MAVESKTNETSAEKNVKSETINAADFSKINGDGELIFTETRLIIHLNLIHTRKRKENKWLSTFCTTSVCIAYRSSIALFAN